MLFMGQIGVTTLYYLERHLVMMLNVDSFSLDQTRLWTHIPLEKA